MRQIYQNTGVPKALSGTCTVRSCVSAASKDTLYRCAAHSNSTPKHVAASSRVGSCEWASPLQPQAKCSMDKWHSFNVCKWHWERQNKPKQRKRTKYRALQIQHMR